jgi:hypothetical protein
MKYIEEIIMNKRNKEYKGVIGDYSYYLRVSPSDFIDGKSRITFTINNIQGYEESRTFYSLKDIEDFLAPFEKMASILDTKHKGVIQND